MQASKSTRVSPFTVEDRKRYRDQATGIGQTIDGSRATGARRNQRIVDNAAGRDIEIEDNSYPESLVSACGVQVTLR